MTHPHSRGDARLHLIQLLHGRVDRDGDHGVVQVRAGPPLVPDRLLGHKVVGHQRGLPVPPTEDLKMVWKRACGGGGGKGEGKIINTLLGASYSCVVSVSLVSRRVRAGASTMLCGDTIHSTAEIWRLLISFNLGGLI